MIESSSTCGDTTSQYGYSGIVGYSAIRGYSGVTGLPGFSGYSKPYENSYTKKSTNIEEIMRQFDASKPKKVSFIRRLLNVFK